MPDRPLLRLPDPSAAAPPAGRGGGGTLRFPTQDRQRNKFGPVFGRLRSLLGRDGGVLELRADPTSLAPDRVIVFEIAGTVADFLKAVGRVEGLEFMAELEDEFDADEDFAVPDKRKGREGQDRTDVRIPGRFYLAMPDVRALENVLSLWALYERGEPMPRGFGPFRNLFAQMRDVRAWGPQDRIPRETVDFWRDETRRHPGQPVRTEVELWFRGSEERRRVAAEGLARRVVDAGGTVVHESVIPDIAYHGALIDIPAAAIQDLIEQRTVSLALADDVMFLRPQSLLLGPLEVEGAPDAGIGEGDAPPPGREPVAALLDGVPVQAHGLLAGRLVLDDPDDLQSRAIVSRRLHGTAMASLILHGDRNEDGAPLPRPLYVRPVMITTVDGERTEANQLIVDTIYRAVVGMKGAAGAAGTAPSVFLVNISLGDPRRPFTRVISPLARLLDFLAARHNVLFLVSGGNVSTPLDIPDFDNWTAFESAAVVDRERAVVRALNAAKRDRTIISPAESLNALTIGAQHDDNVDPRPGPAGRIDPFGDSSLPNVSSGLGLGHRRMIKPDLYFPGGREYVGMLATGGGVRVSVGGPQRLFGLRAAAPDPSGQGRLDQTALSDGTSSATALATRSGHLIFDALMDEGGGSPFADMDPQFYAVVVKCLLVHGSKWNGSYDALKEICGPAEARRFVERAENSSRFVGFGVPDIGAVVACAPNRATLVGYGTIEPDSGRTYRIPLPGCLERVTEPRSLTVTLAWFSPIRAGHRSYRSVRLETGPVLPAMEVLGVTRGKNQPAHVSVRRGSVLHERFEGAAAVPFVDDGHLVLQVWCKEDAGVMDAGPVRYGIAVTIESQGVLPVYDEIQARLRIRPRP